MVRLNQITKPASDMGAAVKPDTLTAAWQKTQMGAHFDDALNVLLDANA